MPHPSIFVAPNKAPVDAFPVIFYFKSLRYDFIASFPYLLMLYESRDKDDIENDSNDYQSDDGGYYFSA